MELTTPSGEVKTLKEISEWYEIGDMLVFGPETRGLPESLLDGKEDTCIRIPMVDEARSLNLSNAVAIIAYEGMRQLDYPDLKAEGNWIQSK